MIAALAALAFGAFAPGVAAGAAVDTVVVDTVTVLDLVVAPAETLRVTSQGQGRPLVLIPGLYGGAYSYRKITAPLATAGFRVVVIDPLGTGWSSYPAKADYSLTAQSDRIAHAMQLLGVRRAVVVSSALASSIALRLAYRHTDLVAALVSIDGGPAETASTPGLRRAMRFAPLLKLFVGAGTIRGKLRRAMIENSADGTWVTDDVVNGYAGAAARNVHGAIDVMRAISRSTEPEPLRDQLAKIRIPVTLLLGGAPHDSGPSAVEVGELVARLPSFAVDTIQNAGQFIYEERPDAVVAAVKAITRR